MGVAITGARPQEAEPQAVRPPAVGWVWCIGVVWAQVAWPALSGKSLHLLSSLYYPLLILCYFIPSTTSYFIFSFSLKGSDGLPAATLPWTERKAGTNKRIFVKLWVQTLELVQGWPHTYNITFYVAFKNACQYYNCFLVFLQYGGPTNVSAIASRASEVGRMTGVTPEIWDDVLQQMQQLVEDNEKLR